MTLSSSSSSSSSSSFKTGHTPTGHDFPVPQTADMFHTLASPSRCGPAEFATHFTLLLTLLSLALLPYLPVAFYISIFAFWRFAYNIGIGVMLHYQSKHQTITNWLKSRSSSARALLHWAVAKPVVPPYNWASVPASFNAWLVFRSLSTMILANDGTSYFVLAVACFRPLSDSRLCTLLIALPTGAALLALSFWAKAAAHKALGDFAWFWGDFFFTVDSQLVLDGVFELFPHPMYTVGYAGYYGLALLCRSYTLLFISLIAHSAQLAFLALVEEPHIKKIYAFNDLLDEQNDDATKEDQPHPIEQMHQDTTLQYHKFVASAPQSPVLMAVFILSGLLVFICSVASISSSIVISILLLCRVGHWVGCAYMLTREENSAVNRWMKWCSARGSNTEQAYSSWQHVFLLSYVLNNTFFVIACVSLPVTNSTAHAFMRDGSFILGGLSLVAIAVVSMISAWSVTGYYAFFYGDFFVTPETRELQYKGSFRYVTHPEASLGYLAYYGIAIMRQSHTLFLVAMSCQIMHMLFISLIEKEHLGNVYKFVRTSTALESSVENLPLVGALLTCMRRYGMQVTGIVQQSSENHFKALSNTLAVKKEKLHADINKKSLTIWNEHVKPTASDLKERAKSHIDCNKMILMLEKQGVVVERVPDLDNDVNIR